jgi:hypothetical protein
VRLALIVLLLLAAAAPARADLRALRKLAGPAMAVVSLRRAWQGYRDPRKSPLDKSLDVAGAGADVVGLVFPVAGAVGGATVTGVSAGASLYRWHQRHQRAARIRLWLKDAGVSRPH